MRSNIESEVIIYHDETKSAGIKRLKGHALLFVPVRAIIKETGGLFGTQKRQVIPLNVLFKEIEKINASLESWD